MPRLPNDVLDWRDMGRTMRWGEHDIFVVDTNSHAGPVVLILHGFPSSSFDWYRVVPKLAARTRVVAFDFLGYGLSAKPADARYSLFEQADLAEAVAANHGATSVVLVTHDMGQTVGAELAKRQLEGSLGFEIVRVILTNGSTFIDLAELSDGQQLLLSLPDEPLTESLPLDGLKPGLQQTFSREHPPDAAELDAMIALLQHADGDRLLPRLIRYIDERRLHQDRWTSGLVDLDVPTTAVWGEQDPIAVVAMAERLASLRPNTEVVRWPDVGHWPSIEVPDRMASTILDRL